MAEESTPYADNLRAWLKSPENVAAYLKAVFEENAPDSLRLAILDVAKAREGDL